MRQGENEENIFRIKVCDSLNRDWHILGCKDFGEYWSGFV
jgi:hypothetical protein